jgi:hypothetical protein
MSKLNLKFGWSEKFNEHPLVELILLTFHNNKRLNLQNAGEFKMPAECSLSPLFHASRFLVALLKIIVLNSSHLNAMKMIMC